MMNFHHLNVQDMQNPSILNKYEDTKRILAKCEKVYLAKRLDATPCFQIVFNDDYFWL